MAQSRLDLHTLLKTILPDNPVYFQQPTNNKMQFPCIIYKRDDSSVQHADNEIYRHHKRYQVTVIVADPDSDIPDKVERLPLCEFNRYFTADQLNHYVYNLYF